MVATVRLSLGKPQVQIGHATSQTSGKGSIVEALGEI